MRRPAHNRLGFRLLLSRFASPTFRFASPHVVPSRRDGRPWRGYVLLLALALLWAMLAACGLRAQATLSPAPEVTPPSLALGNAAAARTRAERFLNARRTHDRTSVAAALSRAAAPPSPQPRTASLTAAWTALGPQSIASPTFGALTGRVTSLALDANDATGNTLYVGTTGGGVWKSTNAAGPLASITFTPLTDTLPVFNSGAGSSATASLSIGALAVQPAANPVLLAGTGDPNDATDSYFGSGILRSTDNGLTWALVQGSKDGANGNHSFLGLSVAGFAFSTATPSVVVAAVSSALEGDLTAATNSSSVRGLYYSNDAGVTWHMSTVYDGTQIVQQPLSSVTSGNAATAVVWNPLRQRFFAAIRLHGFYESADGINWTRLAVQPGTTLTLANCPTNTSAGCPLFRGVLAVQPLTGDTYALSVDAANHDNGLWQDLCSASMSACALPEPAFAARIDNGALDVGGVIAQGDYDLALAASPTATGTTLFAGTVDLYRCAISSNSSACTLRNTTNALNGCNAPATVAPAQHALAVLSQFTTNPLIFLGNDGGLWRSLDGANETGSVCSASDASHFDNLNPTLGSLAEITGFAQHPTDANTLLAGLGGLGSAATTSAATLGSWPQMSAGEGGFPQLDAATPANWFLAIGAGVNLKACTLGASCTAANFVPPATIGLTQVNDDQAVLDAPTLLDPADTANVLLATCRIWRGPAADGSMWASANAISTPLGGSAPCTASSPLYRAIAAGGTAASSASAQNSGSEVIYAGLAGTLTGGGTLGGHVFLTKTANTATSSSAWADIALSPVTNDTANGGVFNPDGFDIAALAADAHDATGATVYAAILGFGSATGAASPHLYRSTDFGAHWLNISANLPGTPANAVLVDPNDANTVYVALDTGVYVTSAVSTCASTNCWSVFGTSLPNAPVIALAAAPQMLTGDGRRGMLRAATYGRGLWQQPLLNAISIAQPALTLSAVAFSFPAQQVATQSTAQTLTLTSNGNSPVTVSSIAIAPSDFIETDTCTGQTLAVNATCTISIVFAPIAAGTRSATLTVFANITSGQATASLSGTGTAAASIVFTPVALTFAATLVSQTAAAQIVTVANTGGNVATLQTPVITGDFSITASTCGASLAAQTACSLSIAFTPAASGARAGTLSLADSVGTQTASLSGTGEAPATDTLSASALTFPQTTIGATSPTQQVTITNAGDVALTLIAASVSGPFTVVNACGNSLAAKSTCALQVAFVPTASGSAAGTLTVTDQFRFQTVALSGIGVAPPGVSLKPTSLTFPATGVGLAAGPQMLTLTNNGGSPLTLTSTIISGDFQLATTTCAASVAANASCTFTIIFTPTAAGARTGALTLTDNAPSVTQTAAFSGAAVDFTLAANGADSATAISGTSANYSLLLTAPLGVGATATLACTGAPAHALCSVTPAAVSLGGALLIDVTVQTGLSSVRLTPPTLGPRFHANPVEAMLCTLLLLPAFAVRRRRRLVSLALLLFVGCALPSLAGCGAGRTIPGNGVNVVPTPTPSGTYTLTVSANSTGLTRSVPLTLTVQ